MLSLPKTQDRYNNSTMDNAVVHYIDALGGYGPLYLISMGIIFVAVFVMVKYLPFIQSYKSKQLEIESEREKRKAEELRIRVAQESERAAISRSQIEAQERSTAAMNAMTQQMAIFEARIEASQHGSHAMQEKVDDMAVEVHDIHTVVVKG